MSDESTNEAQEAHGPITAAYAEENHGDSIVVNATVLNEEDNAMSDNGSFLDEDMNVATEEDDEESIACAVILSPEAGNDTPVKSFKSPQKNDEVEKEEDSSIHTKKKRKISPIKKQAGIPSVKDLGIPFRAIKRIMKIDPDIATVQNEAAMVTTYALELFVKKIVNESYVNAKKRGRNTVK